MRRLCLLISLTACKASISEGMDDAGAGSDAPRADALPLGPWGPPEPIGITPVGDDDPTATGDLLELYFNRSSDIFVTKRSSPTGGWSTPTAVAELNSADAETTPEVSYDGLTIYFASARMPTLGGNDVWVSTRASRADAWGTPVHVTDLSSVAADGGATTVDATIAMFDSDRAGTTTLDIYMSQRASATAAWSTPALVPELESASNEGNPMLAADKLTVYFDSNRGGDGELYAATRTTEAAPFAPPARIVELSSTAADTDPWISPDGRTMYFTSDRDGTLRLWQTTR
ncbi:MAG TPA: hypothetical protein VFV99_14270 [Kofleriaceae bacterium]|nr:hypothetical protein [Kofleriaceae bacterium]